jgi:4-amino-4-deoxy-L-arabinose transferase-like glycosyltransferase
MPGPVLSARERAAWIGAFVLIAALIVFTRFTSSDPDSALYASISAKLSPQPMSRWVAPEWWGLWPGGGLTGFFREHPAGLFLLPAALGRLGLPAEQGAYIFGVGCGLAALLLTSWLVARLTSREDGRAVLVLLQVMPVAFIFRIRDNHEYPMFVCLLASLIGLVGVTRSWRWLALVALELSCGLLVKGVFVVLLLIAAGLWIAINPLQASRARQVAALAASLACMAAIALAYDAWYLKATGEVFWSAYWKRQLGPMVLTSPLGQAWTFAKHLGFYVARLLFHPAPWSLALAWSAWRPGQSSVGHRRVRTLTERRGLIFALSFTILSVMLLSAASRFAERYAFSATYMVGAAGAVVAFRSWPLIPRALTRLEAEVPALPVVLWLALMLLRLALGPFLPRLGGL